MLINYYTYRKIELHVNDKFIVTLNAAPQSAINVLAAQNYFLVPSIMHHSGMVTQYIFIIEIQFFKYTLVNLGLMACY